jgi:hypothetical protein
MPIAPLRVTGSPILNPSRQLVGTSCHTLSRLYRHIVVVGYWPSDKILYKNEVKVFKVAIRPAMIYSAETWAIKKTQDMKMNVPKCVSQLFCRPVVLYCKYFNSP